MMRRFALFFVALAFLFAAGTPVRAQAQTPITFDFLDVQFWPDYDQPSVLVLYDFAVSSDTPLPATVTFRIPKDADLIAVAVVQSGGMLNVPYNAPTPDGDMQVFSFEISNTAAYRIEYYMPYEKDGATRKFTYRWSNGYEVARFQMSLQQPVDATNVSTGLPTTPRQANDGFTYFVTAQNSLMSGQEVAFEASYTKASDTLSAANMQVQPAGGGVSVAQSISWSTYLPWALAALGLVMIVGGAIWYRQSGMNTSARKNRGRKRHQMQEEDDEEEGEARYCSQCGKRASPSDKFCRTCGTRLRTLG